MATWFRLSLVMLIAVLCACQPEEEVESEVPEAPPPPTPQEIAQSIITELNLDRSAASTGGRISNAAREQLVSQLRNKAAQYNGTVDGKEALSHVKGRIERRIREFSSEGAWQYVLVFVELHKVIDPDSKKYGSLMEEAYLQLKKPKLSLRGMPVLDGRRIIVMEFYLPANDETYKEKIAVGDELHGVRIVDVFGNNRGVTVEFLETGERSVIFLEGRA